MAKKQYVRIDAEGYIVNLLQYEEHITPVDEDIITAPADGFYKPKWDGTQWVEGLTPEEIEAIQNQPQEPTEIELLQQENADLKSRLTAAEDAILTLMFSAPS